MKHQPPCFHHHILVTTMYRALFVGPGCKAIFFKAIFVGDHIGVYISKEDMIWESGIGVPPLMLLTCPLTSTIVLLSVQMYHGRTIKKSKMKVNLLPSMSPSQIGPDEEKRNMRDGKGRKRWIKRGFASFVRASI